MLNRELVDLLKTAPHSQLPFHRLIPAYHHHFGKQCRVADYGFTKLIDLLEALAQTIQVMGEGNKRVVTLSHRAQVHRFTLDLLRVLKAQASKQVPLSEFPSIYARVITKPWDVVDYGVCDIADILSEVSEKTVVVANLSDNDKLIAIPKREQTAEEIERTKQFAFEVVELLRHAPQCRMLFNKFVPSYHHHFGHQCRVSDYGFAKLVELFEAIPEVVKIEETNGGERRISLTEEEGLRVLGEQLLKLITRGCGSLSVTSIAQVFARQFGYNLKPELFGCKSILQLMEKLNGTVKIVQTATGPMLTAVDKLHMQQMAHRCRRVMMSQSRNHLPVKDFHQLYSQYNSQASVGVPHSSTSPFRDTDSSNESYDNDSSFLLEPTNNASFASDELTKRHNWKQKTEGNQWHNSDEQNRWAEQQPSKWSTVESSSDNFLKSLTRTPDAILLPPSKPDSPNEDENIAAKCWNSSVWTNSASYGYNREEPSTNVVLPLFNLPQWNQTDSGDSASNLLSPMRNLLPAAANPLDPRTSPYFSANRSPVVAPHPSELPLPSLPLTPKKAALTERTEFNNIERNDVSVGCQTPEKDASFETDGGQHGTPSKQRLLSGKRRLAAQFNQPIAS